jgi:hypothetical protein
VPRRAARRAIGEPRERSRRRGEGPRRVSRRGVASRRTAYFDLLAPNAVFFGTDASERWDKEAFRAFAHPYFAQGKGWTFKPRDRHLDASRGGDVLWFDEMLDSESYGECRGNGRARAPARRGWKITQYHLTIPIPNDLAKDFVARIRARTPPPPKP